MAGKVRKLPFPSGTKFFDVEGMAVAWSPTKDGGRSTTAFDPSPRPFPLSSVFRNGAEVSREEFDALVAAAMREASEAPTYVFRQYNILPLPRENLLGQENWWTT